MKSFQTLLAGQTLLPIIQADSAEQGVKIASAMQAGGIHLVEVVLRTAQSIDALKAIKEALPDMVVGAGTVVDKDNLVKAHDAQADFIVTPAISIQLLDLLKDVDLPVVPGISNAADILLAREYGYRELKLFPASLSGGEGFIQAMSSVFPDVVFCPTGGVNADNQQQYLSQKNCFAVGGTWVAKGEWVREQQWHLITQACKRAISQ